MATPNMPDYPERHETMRPPEITETDQAHIKAYMDFLVELQKKRMDSVRLTMALNSLLQTTVQPAGNDFSDIKDQVDEWVAKYAFDTNSTMYGDRTTDVMDTSISGVHTYSDPDGSGKRSADTKRAAAMYDIAMFLVACPDTRLSSVARGSIIGETAKQVASYRQQPLSSARRQFRQDLLHYAQIYRETGETEQLMLVLGAASYGALITEQHELANI